MTDLKYLATGVIVSELIIVACMVLTSRMLLMPVYAGLAFSVASLVQIVFLAFVCLSATFFGVYISLLRLPKRPLGSPKKGLMVALFQLLIAFVLVVVLYFLFMPYSTMYPDVFFTGTLIVIGGHAVGCITGGVAAGLVVQRKSATMVCKNCGAQMPHGAKFCGKCGAKI